VWRHAVSIFPFAPWLSSCSAASKFGKESAMPKTAKKAARKAVNKWSAKVTSDATHPEPGLFTEDAKTIAEHLATKSVSPKGPAQGMQMLNFYINRAGKNLPEERHRELERAKELLHKIIEDEKQQAAS
jgi:tRNA(adenine34) deaminase